MTKKIMIAMCLALAAVIPTGCEDAAIEIKIPVQSKTVQGRIHSCYHPDSPEVPASLSYNGHTRPHLLSFSAATPGSISPHALSASHRPAAL